MNVVCAVTVFSGANILPYPLCTAASLPQCLSIYTEGEFSLPHQEWIEQHSFLGTVLAVGCVNMPCTDGLTELMCVFPRLCLAHQMMLVLNKKDSAACSCW